MEPSKVDVKAIEFKVPANEVDEEEIDPTPEEMAAIDDIPDDAHGMIPED